jgi:hypothetical protein
LDDFAVAWLLLWPALVVANAVPGLTPQKRKAPDPQLDGQIQKPGAAPPPPDNAASKRPRSASASKGARAAASASDVSKSDSDASASASEEPVVVSDDDQPASTACMPPKLGTGVAFADLARSTCARSWNSSSRFEGGLPAAHARTLWRARLWSTKERRRLAARCRGPAAPS